jgi:hypothetical protein
MSNAPENPLFDICFTDSDTGYATSWSYEKVYKTTNGGMTWFIQASGFSGYDDYKSVAFIDGRTGVVVGGSGKIYRTSDGGNSWTSITSHSVTEYRDVAFVSTTTGYAVGRGGIISITTDAGLTWTTQFSHTNNDINALCFINSSIGTVVGSSGLILRTNNGGIVSAIKRPIAGIPQRFRLNQNFPNPFNPGTTITFDLPSGGKQFVLLKVFDLLGREVATLVDGTVPSGEHVVRWDAGNLPSGAYFYRLEAVRTDGTGNRLHQTRKMLLLK